MTVLRNKMPPNRTFWICKIAHVVLAMVVSCMTFNPKTTFWVTANDEYCRVYVGTFTRGKQNRGQGIYFLQLNAKTGELSNPTVVATTDVIENPSFLTIHPNKNHLYAVSEIRNYNKTSSGAVYAFRLHDKNQSLTLLNQKPTLGEHPCHLSVDKSGQYVLVANYGTGSVASFEIQNDGSLQEACGSVQHDGSSIHPQRQEGPHAHAIETSPDGQHALVADLGLDQVLVYQFNSGKLALNSIVDFKPGAGPRHFSFHPNGKFVYVINELDLTITSLVYHETTGKLSMIQTVSTISDTNPQEQSHVGTTTAEICVHPSGKFLYGSNRGHDNSIVVYQIHPETGRLNLIQKVPTQGKIPRNFAIDPDTGTWLLVANQESDSIVVFQIDLDSGKLQATGHVAHVPSPVCIQMTVPRRQEQQDIVPEL